MSKKTNLQTPGEKRAKTTSLKRHLKVCKVFKVKPLKTPKPDVHQRRQHTIYFAKTFKRLKKSCRVFLSPKQVQSYRRNGKRLRLAKKRCKNAKTFTKKKNNNMKSHYKDKKKIMRMKWRSLTFTKSAARTRGRNLKKHQMIQARKNRSLKKPMEKHHYKTASKNPKNY